MATDWTISRSTHRCYISGRDIREGEIYFSALFESPEGLERRDYASESWTGIPEGSFCCFKTRLATPTKPRTTLVVDHDMLMQLFQQLEEQGSASQQQFRFVLALLLMRKRLLRLESTEQEAEQEFWRLRRTADNTEHRVLNPQLTSDEIQRLSDQLVGVLSGDHEVITTISEAAPPPPEPLEPAAPAQGEDQ